MAIELKYPLEDDDYKARVSFRCYKENRPTINQEALRLANNFADRLNFENLIENFVGADKEKAEDAAKEPNSPSEFQTVKNFKVTKSDVGLLKMYMPQQIQFADRAEYTNVDLGILGAGVAGGIRAGESGLGIVKNMFANAKDTFASIKDLVAQGLGREGAQIAALRLTRFSEGIQGAIETETGLTINPNRRATFRGIGLRRFNFNFSMVPTSQKEATEIKRIVGFLKEQVYPELSTIIPGTDNTLSAGLKFPNKFQIKLQYNIDGKYQSILGHILPCFLESVNVTYNPNAMAFHSDGNPQETQISVSFIEERALNKNDIQRENREMFNGFINNSANTILRPRARPDSTQLPEVPI